MHVPIAYSLPVEGFIRNVRWLADRRYQDHMAVFAQTFPHFFPLYSLQPLGRSLLEQEAFVQSICPRHQILVLTKYRSSNQKGFDCIGFQ